MKKNVLLIMLLTLASVVKAQEPHTISLNVYGGYTFMDRVRFDAAYADVQDGFEWGGGLEYFVQRNSSVELKYKRMNTTFPLYGPLGAQLNKDNNSGSVQFITIGGNQYFASGTGAKAIPFIGGALGVGILTGPENSTTKFGWDVQAGVKLKTSSAISLKLHAYLQSITSTFGSDFWYYPGWGTYAVPDYVTLLQFGVGGVLSFDFRKK